MPLFEFRCAECGTEFEKLVHKAGQHDGVACPVCRSQRVDELLSTFASPGKSTSASGTTSGNCKPAGG